MFVCERPQTDVEAHTRRRISVLRNLKSRGSQTANLHAKIQATRLLDEVEGEDAIKLLTRGREETETNQPPLQEDGLVIVGNDVESLFPSIRDVEAARMSRIAMIESRLRLEDFNLKMALRYLKIVGGKGYLRRIGLGKYEPTWTGKREDLIALGGEKTQSEGAWRDKIIPIPEAVGKKIMGYVLEVAVLVAMNTHLYEFNGQVYLQQVGGPIGMRFTACLAAVLMKLWDAAWLGSMEKEGLDIDLYMRYVDDSRNMLRPLAPGWRWDNGFKFREEWAAEDREQGTSSQVRTTTELTKAMNGLVWFLQLTGEDSSMFEDARLPTLDTALWVDEDHKIRYMFYEKPTVPNRVLQSDTALSEMTIVSSLTQEVVRRLLNCSLGTPKAELCGVLSKFAQKMVNSGHSYWTTKVILVQGVTKFNYLVEMSKLSERNKRYKPLHLPKSFKESERQLGKQLARSTWHRGRDETGNQAWRTKLNGAWRGNCPVQRPVRGMKYSTVLQVPSTQGSVLLREIARMEPRLAKASGFSVKIVEKSGIQLVRLFDRKMEKPTCGRVDCPPCARTDKKSRCKKCNVVYKATCMECKIDDSN